MVLRNGACETRGGMHPRGVETTRTGPRLHNRLSLSAGRPTGCVFVLSRESHVCVGVRVQGDDNGGSTRTCSGAMRLRLPPCWGTLSLCVRGGGSSDALLGVVRVPHTHTCSS
jgi:hypothetical protein